MKLILNCFLIVFFLTVKLSAQEISGTVKEYNSNKTIAFATVKYLENRGVITNEEGYFKIPNIEGVSQISISSIGYETRMLNIEEMDSVIYLKPNTIELSSVFISNSKMEPEAIVEKALASVQANYDFGLRKKRFFMRKSYIDKVNELKLDVEESTVEGIDQKFMDNIIEQIPNYIDSYREYFGDFYGDYETQKVQLLKVANLENPINEGSADEIVERFEKILQENVKEGTFLKVKSGIIGFKMDSEELNEEIEDSRSSREPGMKTAAELEEEDLKKRRSTLSRAQVFITDLMKDMFWLEDIRLDVFEKTRKYDFTVEGYIAIQNSIAYVVAFEPKRGADFKGKIYVDTEDFGIHRLEYENVKILKSFSLFGISTQDNVFRGKMIFNKNDNNKYAPKFIEQQFGNRVEVDRPLSLLVKKDGFLFKKKLQEVDLELKIDNSSLNKLEFFIYDDESLQKSNFEEISVSENFEYKTFKKYDPEFWSDYNILEPNTAIKQFTSLENE
ncbi:carboxypeptidase-like regulatory domain-containing protein [Christiangramia forsetii]|uniref:Secreted protein n=2 Tax=Christiangramia forsetii TaxID=411153 RepID=A0M5P4_CHRFK|nr:carboxypeptidase-like regulatory domain-containing protein [Christiangramia forsetii]GGG32497.1 hypothetical protein GCM10011532_15050 [Christiangramia forsetii]CAL67939.1 conserved hypothetical protein, secreted [Christiangramia forsetii KT0803]